MYKWVLIKRIKFSRIIASIITGEQSFKLKRGGLWEVRVTVILFVNPLVQFGSSLCASLGLVPVGGPLS